LLRRESLAAVGGWTLSALAIIGLVVSVSATANADANPRVVGVGEKAPQFSLPNLKGETVQLSDFRGKTVVLEWFNPDCPFVRYAHKKGMLKNSMRPRYGPKGKVVWLAINSSGPGKQGHGLRTNSAGQGQFKMDYPVLLDESGAVGRAYGATRTPEIFVVNPQGILVYRGAPDDTGGGDIAPGMKVRNFVTEALTDLRRGRAIRTSSYAVYGCSVKYAR